MNEPSPKERLLATLDRRGNVVDVGIEALLDESGVAKASLYQHFGSKEGLLLEWLDSRQQRLMARFQSYIEARSKGEDPASEIDAAFGFLEMWLARPDFAGCPFLTTVLRLKDPQNPVSVRARWYSDQLLAFFEERLRALGARSWNRAATHLLGLYLGAIVVQELGTGVAPAAEARRGARRLVGELRRDSTSQPKGRRAASRGSK